MLRQNQPPICHLDFNDRHLTRATHDAGTLDLYIRYEQHRTRQGWHQILQHLAVMAGLMAMYMSAVLVLLYFAPDLGARYVGWLATGGLSSAGGGYGVYRVGRAIHRRYRDRAASHKERPI
jgi:hypothetical protein